MCIRDRYMGMRIKEIKVVDNSFLTKSCSSFLLNVFGEFNSYCVYFSETQLNELQGGEPSKDSFLSSLLCCRPTPAPSPQAVQQYLHYLLEIYYTTANKNNPALLAFEKLLKIKENYATVSSAAKKTSELEEKSDYSETSPELLQTILQKIGTDFIDHDASF
eukprot:TRINITY_DN67974_c0_g1_i6.p1 TRINITY_DN67974_c0_g1~~TRINITY_DN67974_c0_g1_i6.p1  ORF type:complete len:162 (-),score=30.37 TRINITY_DN67974_c0_g1_i6:191-676(-)